MRSASRSLTVLSVVVGVVLAAGLLGSDQPTCQPVEPGQPVCLTALDCEGLAHDLCVGSWTCVEAVCAWACDDPDPTCGGHQSGTCPAGQTCECGSDPNCPACAVCWFSCVPDETDPCASEPGVGACTAPLTCQCRPPADCPMCSSCGYGCYPADGKCRSDADCWYGSRCDFTGTPDYCGMIMAPVLPPACWGTCQTCPGICPAIACPPSQFLHPCTCECLSS